eukprot:SAG31_NODE_43457_length_267_cov_0.613095_1_plen_40_part_10
MPVRHEKRLAGGTQRFEFQFSYQGKAYRKGHFASWDAAEE